MLLARAFGNHRGERWSPKNRSAQRNRLVNELTSFGRKFGRCSFSLPGLLDITTQLLHSIEKSPEVEERLSQLESKWQATCRKLFVDCGINNIDIPSLSKEELRRSIISDLFRERCKSMGIFDLVESIVNVVSCLITYFLTLPEAQPILKSIQRDEQPRIDEANKLSGPVRSRILRLGVENLDSWQRAELWRPLREVIFRRVEPPFDPLMTNSEWATNFFDIFYNKVCLKFFAEREKQLRESDEGRAFTFSRSGKGFERAIENHIDHENKLSRSARDQVDLIIYSLRKRAGYPSSEVKEGLHLVGESLTDEAIRQRYSRLERKMRNDTEVDSV